MGFIFTDSFDHYTAMPGTSGAKWDLENANSYSSINASYGRFSTAGVRCTSQNSSYYLLKTLPSNYGTLYFGFAYKIAEVPSTNMCIMSLRDSNTTQCGLNISAAGKLMTYNGWLGGGTVLQTSSLSYPANEWHFVEGAVTISETGSFRILVDEVEWIDSSTCDTRVTANNYAGGFALFGQYGSAIQWTCYVDDLYIHDTANQGDVRVIYRAPDGAGAHTDWTPSAGANWQCVDEAAPDTADYVSTATTSNVDTYTMTDLTQTTGTILAVVGNYFAQKTDAGARSIAMTTRLSGTDLDSTGKAVASSWGYLQFIQETKPGGGAWTLADTKSAEMGMKVTA